MDIENPCFCIKLKLGAIIVSVVDFMLGGWAILVAAYVVSTIGLEVFNSQPGNHTGTSYITTYGYLGLILSYFLILSIWQMLLSVLLILGIIKEKRLFLKIWLGLKALGSLFSLGRIILGLTSVRDEAAIKPTVLDGVMLVYTLYSIWIIYALVVQIKKQLTTEPLSPLSPESL